MILRRLVENLKHQHWTGVFIELVIVVLGVFIGMQVSNWNQQRATDQQAAVFTARLKADLREEAWGYEMQIGYYQQVIANARRAADALSGKASSSDEALLVAAYRTTQYNATIRRRTTYDELTSTGEMGLIQDEATRDLALRLYNFAALEAIVDEAEHSEYRHWFRLNMPHEVQQALSDACGDRVVLVGDYKGIASALDHACSLQLPPEAIAEATAILRNDKAVLPLLRLRIADVQTSLKILTFYTPDIRDGLRAVAGKHP